MKSAKPSGVEFIMRRCNKTGGHAPARMLPEKFAAMRDHIRPRVTCLASKVSGKKRRVKKAALFSERYNERIGSLHPGVKIGCLKGDGRDK